MTATSIKFDVFEDVLADLQIAIPQIEREIGRIPLADDPAENVRRIYRALVTLKRNFDYCGAGELSAFVSAMEEVLAAIKAETFGCSDAVSEALLQGLDRAKEMAMGISGAQSPAAGPTSPKPFGPLFIRMANAESQAEADALAEDIIAISAERFQVAPDYKYAIDHELDLVPDAGELLRHEDMAVFLDLAGELDKRNPYWTNRSAVQINLALAINRQLSEPVDSEQLLVAVCWHDMGMMLLPDRILLKQVELDEDETRQLRRHVELGSALLAANPRWAEAGRMVLHHHERVDGLGYPAGLKGTEIHPGAQLIALADSFYAMTHQRPDRNHKRSLLRALIEVNSCTGKQFDPRHVEAFNAVVQDMIAR